MKAKLYQIHYKLHTLIKYYQWTVDHALIHAPGSPSKYMTTIYHYFCIKNDYL